MCEYSLFEYYADLFIDDDPPLTGEAYKQQLDEDLKEDLEFMSFMLRNITRQNVGIK